MNVGFSMEAKKPREASSFPYSEIAICKIDNRST
jgi:hypothetical protein